MKLQNHRHIDKIIRPIFYIRRPVALKCFVILIAVLTLFSIATSAQAAVLKSLQNNTTTINDGSSFVEVNISSVETSKSFLVFSISGSFNAPMNGQVTGQIKDETTLRFERYSTSNTITIEWYVAEFTSGVSVQRGTATLTPAGRGDVDVPLSPSVDTSKSFPLISLRTEATPMTKMILFGPRSPMAAPH